MYIVLSGGFKAAEIRIHRITESTTHTTYQSRTETTKFEDNIVNAVSCFRGRGSSGKDGGEVDGLNQRRRLGSKSGRRGLGEKNLGGRLSTVFASRCKGLVTLEGSRKWSNNR